MSARLLVAPPNQPPYERALGDGEIVIGRTETAGLVVREASVSRLHARLFERDGRWWVEDLGARHRALLNNVPLVDATPLADGDRLQIGSTILTYVTGLVDSGSQWQPVPIGAPTDPPPPDRQDARLRTINAIHRALAAPISLDELLDLILDRCFDVLRPEEGVILLSGPNGDWRPVATKRSPRSKGELLISRRLSNEVAGRGRPMLVLDAAEDARFAGAHSIELSGVRSVVAAPLADAQGSLGMVALASRLGVRQFSQDDLDMLVSIASAAALRVRNLELAEQLAARRVLEHELALAHDMQMAMLPRRLPADATIDLAARLTPARSVGGDLYDFFEDGRRLWFLIADVAGKGVAAALVTAVVKTLFRAIVPGETDVPRVLGRMNEALCRDNEQLVFITAVIGYIDLDTGCLSIGDIGHNPAIVIRAGGDVRPVDVPKNIAFGVLPDVTFEAGSLVLGPSEAIVLYTDGVTEARRKDGTLFGGERLEAAIRGAADASAAATLERLEAAVEQFTAGAPPDDDVTSMVLRYRGAR